MKKLFGNLFLLSLLLLSGCSATDPDVPDGYSTYQKGGKPEGILSIQELSQRYVLLKIDIKGTGDRQLVHLRLCYSETNSMPDTTNHSVDIFTSYNPDNRIVFASLPNLDPGTGYYCRAYLANSDYGNYTNDIAFTTKLASDHLSWEEMAPLPMPGKYFHRAFSVNDRAFAISSYRADNLLEGGDMREYLPLENRWVWRADLPWKNRVSPVSLVIDGKAYVGLGDISKRNEDGSTAFYAKNDWWSYDPDTDQWTQKANLPTTMSVIMATFGVGGKGYVMVSATLSDDTSVYVFEYDPVNDYWERKKNFPNKKLIYPASFVIGKRAFVFAGSTAGTGSLSETAFMWEYEQKTDTWIRRADFGGGQREWMVYTATANAGYAGFGSKKISDIQIFSMMDWWKYDLEQDKWIQKNIHASWFDFFPYLAFTVGDHVYIGSSEQGVWKYVEVDK